MKWTALVIVCVCVPLLAVHAPARADLAGEIKAVLQDKYFNKADVGIAIARLGDNGTTDIAYRFDSDIPLIPASNLKLLTTSAFLDRFGPDFKFRTLLLHKDGDLYLIGDGDPTLGDVELLKKVGWDVDTVFRTWAEELKKRNITDVRNVIVDDGVFDEQFTHPNWLDRYRNQRYAAQVGGVNLNANCVDIWVKATSRNAPVACMLNPDTRYVTIKNQAVTGNENRVGVTRPLGKNDLTVFGEIDQTLGNPISVPIEDPPMYAATVLSETLARSGVSVTGEVRRDRAVRERYGEDLNGWSVVAALDTRLATVLDRANKDSVNLYAECLLKRLGHQATDQPGSWANGTAAVGEFLKAIGVETSQFKLDDGCGLSRENAVSAEALLKVLIHNYHGPNRDAFVSSLAVAGADGTFEKRFKSDLKGRVFGKSGYINNVSALTGYVRTQSERWYAFSILMNNLPGGTNPTAKTMQERIVATIDDNAK